jgi:hypothetical protein
MTSILFPCARTLRGTTLFAALLAAAACHTTARPAPTAGQLPDHATLTAALQKVVV